MPVASRRTQALQHLLFIILAEIILASQISFVSRTCPDVVFLKVKPYQLNEKYDRTEIYYQVLFNIRQCFT